MSFNMKISENIDINSIQKQKDSRVVMMDIKLVFDNPLNKDIYGDCITDDIKETIEDELYTPIIVTLNDDERTYRIVSGHRRVNAIREIFNSKKSIKYMDNEYKDKVPVLIHPGFESEEVEKRAIITANVQRDKTNDEIKKEAEILKKYYTNLKNDGLLEKGDRDIIKHVSEDLKIGRTKTKKLLSNRSKDKNEKWSRATKNETDSKDEYYQSIMTELNKIEKYLVKLDLQKIGKTEKLNVKNKLIKITNIIYEK